MFGPDVPEYSNDDYWRDELAARQQRSAEQQRATSQGNAIAQIVKVLDSSRDDGTKVALINLIVGRC